MKHVDFLLLNNAIYLLQIIYIFICIYLFSLQSILFISLIFKRSYNTQISTTYHVVYVYVYVYVYTYTYTTI